MLLASLVDNLSSRPEEFATEEDQQRERERLFELIEELVKSENVNNERILLEAPHPILVALGHKANRGVSTEEPILIRCVLPDMHGT